MPLPYYESQNYHPTVCSNNHKSLILRSKAVENKDLKSSKRIVLILHWDVYIDYPFQVQSTKPTLEPFVNSCCVINTTKYSIHGLKT